MLEGQPKATRESLVDDTVEIDTPMGVVRSTSGALAEAMAELLAMDFGGADHARDAAADAA